VNILNAQQIREWDQYTIQHEPISSINLMERAAAKCAVWIENRHIKEREIKVFCGKGNNGGDGLALARMLLIAKYKITVYILESGKPGSADFEENLKRLHDLPLEIYYLKTQSDFPDIEFTDILIDALFGSGLNKPLQDLSAALVQHINRSSAPVISIDLPSGLFMDSTSLGNPVIEADHTLTFQVYKTAFLVQENAKFIGEVHVLDIGLDAQFLEQINFNKELVDKRLIRHIYKPRNKFAHKGTFGHALLITGSYGKAGAAILASKACLHSGVGLLTCYLPSSAYTIMQTALPEAMVITDRTERLLTQLPEEIDKYTTIGIGPGIGTAEETQEVVAKLVQQFKRPLVIDADALNCISLHKELLTKLPPHSILTPHPKEFDRIFGEHSSDFDRMATAGKKAKELNIIIILKGHHTLIAMPGGKAYFNSTGNAGMAKGGSGDVLTGILTGLVAQKYEPVQAAILGVYLHGLAGDLAASSISQESMTATDIITFLSQAFLTIHNEFKGMKELL
jgi:ADP-dependent NAD(P)H-hydrate dehydratase / NAD(P)H-hydrate epimerase